jgi:two-component system NtrC family sensor kinase
MTEPRKNILVVDDDDDVRTIISAVMASADYDVREASSGVDALSIITEREPDLILLDYMMPGLSGLEVCQKLRQLPGGSFIPVIMLTARTELHDKLAGLASGADDYVTKPFQHEELLARVRAHLRIRELSRSLQQKNVELERAQDTIIEHERKLALLQFAGSAAHQIGQPLSAIILHCHLLESLPKEDVKFLKALAGIKSDAKRINEIVMTLRNADKVGVEEYHKGEKILTVRKE